VDELRPPPTDTSWLEVETVRDAPPSPIVLCLAFAGLAVLVIFLFFD